MHPFLELSKLTDEQLIEKLGKAYEYMNYQVSLGHNPTVQSIKEVIQSLEDERANRMGKLVEEEAKRKTPDVHKAINLGVVDSKELSLDDIEDIIRKLV